ncbi:MAG: serine/threonine protein kinase [Planctomycetes bacterium]|nr:serine/threonine protein kinase [Planctomycetota bacterium]
MPLTHQQARNLAQHLLDDDEDAPQETPEVPHPPLPQNIGQYRILSLIATGGMGSVYEALQENPERVVALKILKRGIVSRTVLRRFDHEAAVLARLRHPGIAEIYQAGTHQDPDSNEAVPYFAMEYIPHAKTITQYATEHKLSIRERLNLFTQVCDAVHHGHQKGIIHRDLKPANILVECTDNLAPGEHTGGQPCKAATSGRGLRERKAASVSESNSGGGLVKIIDFGIARATDSDIAITTLQTDVRELIGTLQYMSPEQCSGDPHDIDIRSDIYSLGIVLYELLCKQLPYDLHDTALPHATRMVQECDPPRPSTISKTLRGDIEAIVLKALNKKREQRYQSTAELCKEIRRYLAGEPIDARPPSRWSLTMRWVTHHPVMTTTAACLLIAILTVGATSLSVWFLNFRPYEIVITPDRREARLISISGRILHTWRSEAEHGISDATLVDRPAYLGGGMLAIIGFSQLDQSKLLGSLNAFHIQGDLDEPVWSKRVETKDILPELIARDFTGQQFGVHFSKLIDVFQEFPGPEIVTSFKHGPYSAGIIRIYDLTGELLFQLWQDGGVNSLYWMSDAELLVFSGLDARAYWGDRGYSEVKKAHPLVVFGVKPREGHIAHEWITTQGDEIVPWYKCILPPEASDIFGQRKLIRPTSDNEPGRQVRLHLPFANAPNAALSWLINENGVEQRELRIINDPYKRAGDTLPPPDMFYLGDLPPIVGNPSTPAEIDD